MEASEVTVERQRFGRVDPDVELLAERVGGMLKRADRGGVVRGGGRQVDEQGYAHTRTISPAVRDSREARLRSDLPRRESRDETAEGWLGHRAVDGKFDEHLP